MFGVFRENCYNNLYFSQLRIRESDCYAAAW